MASVIKKIIAAILSAILSIFGITYTPSEPVAPATQDYPYIFVHGFAGWGEGSGLSEAGVSYWGSFTGDLLDFLNKNGCECYDASCGPFSSAWDRACELYAQLTGTTVDYGAAHAAKYGHSRYGVTYSTAFAPDWSAENKVNLIAHSFGGNTVRLLSTLMAEGSAEEIAATSQNELSPLFAGGHDGYIYSITTLASPHNGTTLTAVLDTAQGSDFMVAAYYAIAFAGRTDLQNLYDFGLSNWGINTGNENVDIETVKALANTKDSGVYDLTLKGAAELNQQIKIYDDIYYFSYAGDATKKDEETGYCVPVNKDMTSITAAAMGAFTGTVDGYVVDASWLPNDGIVNTVSALYPFSEPQVTFDKTNMQKGVWMVMPVQSFNHMQFTMGSGLSSESANTLADFIIRQINYITYTYNH